MDDLSTIATESALEDASDLTRVLVVDDDETDFFIVKRYLKKARHSRYQLTYVENFDAAAHELQKSEFDVVMLDYHLPGVSSDEFYAALNGGRNLPIIVLTGNESKKLEQKMLDAGASYFLHKNGVCEESLTLSIHLAIRRFELARIERAEHELLRRCLKNAEAANFSKSEFLNFLGDEIKTPLNAIIGFSRALEEMSTKEGTSETRRMYSKFINDSSTHLMALIEDLLELSQTENSEFDPRGSRFKRFRTWIVDKQRAEPSDDKLNEQAQLARSA